ncbi:thioredoxin domain-containing protein [Galbibacter sp. EGI 63066]|uniref:vitamin K epoxide reductase family protein n=1 Tax=Galbibacter sp. EGI 63066 TaxID=2993559 RepID=UPI002248B12E|nr:vitamin K epoxide reductase family protein [Galbibacter sp. EGI 63066]MCX2681950.1 thioredoxin domain-containing protein [Galbibacter sp. EGI 63066]
MIDENSINAVISYLKEIGFIIDKKSFYLKLKKHPNVGSILAISDVLKEKGTDNEVIRVDFENIEYLPENFLYYVKNTGGLAYVKKIESNKYLLENSHYISDQDLRLNWSGIVLLIKNNDQKKGSNFLNRKSIRWIIALLWLLPFLFNLKYNNLGVSFEFFALSFLGLIFSLYAIRLFYRDKSKGNSYCDLSSSINCSSVISSSKNKIYKNIGFTDLSILFFSSQFLGLLIFQDKDIMCNFLFLQKILLLLSIPITFLSLFFQISVIKKWCLLCIGIITTIYVQYLYLFIHSDISFEYNDIFVLNMLILYSGVVTLWFYIKGFLKKWGRLLDYEDRGNRFIKNYDIFKFNLLRSDYLKNIKEVGSNKIILGTPTRDLHITIITDPYCSYCRDIHLMIQKIYNKYKSQLSIEIRFNINPKESNDDELAIYRMLIEAYIDGGENNFLQKYKCWYENGLIEYSENVDLDKSFSDQILKKQFKKNSQYGITKVPQIIINGFQYPDDYYRRDELVYFIDDLIEDMDFITPNCPQV